MFSNHNRMKLEIKNRKKTGIFTNLWKLENTLLNNGGETRNDELRWGYERDK